MNPCCFSGITILKNAGSNDIMKTALAKIKRFFLLIAGTVMIAFSTSGCAFIPTGFYLVSQFDGNPCHIREGNEWPCGNIIHVTNRLIENVGRCRPARQRERLRRLGEPGRLRILGKLKPVYIVFIVFLVFSVQAAGKTAQFS